jgi:hypothetical protein
LQLFLHDGKIKVELLTAGSPKALLDNYEDVFNDGRWHQVILTIGTNFLELNIDGRPMKTVRILSMTTGSVYYIAGEQRYRVNPLKLKFVYIMFKNAVPTSKKT